MDINISWWQLLTGWNVFRWCIAGLIAFSVFFFTGDKKP